MGVRVMSEAENPAAPNPQQPAEKAPLAAAQPAPTSERKPFRPKRERPEPRPKERLEALEDLSSRGPNLRELNSQIQDELDAALAGFSDADMMATSEPAKAPMGEETEPGRKRGRVISIHGEDVFVEVPGGRSQGVLSLQQFEGKPPA